jgi:hypothetical protein
MKNNIRNVKLTREQKFGMLVEMNKYFNFCINEIKKDLKEFEKSYDNKFKIKTLEDFNLFYPSKIWEGDYYFSYNGTNIDIDGEELNEIREKFQDLLLFEKFGYLEELYTNFGMK